MISVMGTQGWGGGSNESTVELTALCITHPIWLGFRPKSACWETSV